AQDFADIGHHRQREGEGGLDPVRDHDPLAAGQAHLERHQEHDHEQDHQPRRVAEQMRHEPRRPSHQRHSADLHQPESNAKNGRGRHGDEAHQEIEPEALEDEGQPEDQRADGRWYLLLGFRLRIGESKRAEKCQSEPEAMPPMDARAEAAVAEAALVDTESRAAHWPYPGRASLRSMKWSPAARSDTTST